MKLYYNSRPQCGSAQCLVSVESLCVCDQGHWPEPGQTSAQQTCTATCWRRVSSCDRPRSSCSSSSRLRSTDTDSGAGTDQLLTSLAVQIKDTLKANTSDHVSKQVWAYTVRFYKNVYREWDGDIWEHMHCLENYFTNIFT